MVRKVDTDEGNIEYLVVRKNVKNLNMRINESGVISVSVGPFVKFDRVDDFVKEKSGWIFSQLDNIKAKLAHASMFNYRQGDILYLFGEKYSLHVRKSTDAGVEIDKHRIIISVPDTRNAELKAMILKRWYVRMATRKIVDIFDSVVAKSVDFNDEYSVKISNVQTRWGSCIPGKKSIMLSARLVAYSEECIRYVVMHELTHLQVPNHSAEFYTALSRNCTEFTDSNYPAMLQDIAKLSFVGKVFDKSIK